MPEQVGTPGVDTPEPSGTTPNPNADKPQVEATPDTQPADTGRAELEQRLREKDAMIGRLGERLGKVDALESELGNLRGYLDQLGQINRQVPEPAPEFDLTNPAAWVDKRLEVERKRLYADFNQYRQKETYDEAVANFTAGRRSAIAQNKELFEGIENDVSNMLWETVKQNPAVRHDLRNPETWEDAAIILRAKRREFDKIIPKKQAAMAPPRTELPGRTARPLLDDDEVQLSDEDRAQAEFEGWTEKEALEAKKAGLDMYRKNQAKGGVRPK